MVSQQPANTQPNDYLLDINTRLRDIEDRLRLLKDRVLLVGKTLVDSRDKTFSEVQELKKAVTALTQENVRMKDIIQRISEQLSNSARKEDFAILQRQLDLLRK